MQAHFWHVEHLPRHGESIRAISYRCEFGGKGLNVAIGLKRLGLSVEVLLGCGEDQIAQEALGHMRNEGLSTDHVHCFAGVSGQGIGLVDAHAQSSICVYPGANAYLNEEHVQHSAKALARASTVYAQFEASMSAIVAAFALAQENNVRTVLNPSPWQEPAPALYQTTHTLIVNAREWQSLCAVEDDEPTAEVVQTFWDKWPGVQCLVVTQGDAGSQVWLRPDGNTTTSSVRKVAAEPTHAQDCTGAGDAFSSGFIFAQLHGATPEQSLRTGNACGAFVTARHGVIHCLPRPQDIAHALSFRR